MSWYMSYTLALRDKDGMFYPLGPFTYDGKKCYVVDRSRSFASDLHEDFYPIDYKYLSKELKDVIYKSWDESERDDIAKAEKNCEYPSGMYPLSYLPLDELPDDNFIKTGYFLTEDIARYERDHDSEGIFYASMTPTEYAFRLSNEMRCGTLGKPQLRMTEDGEEYPEESVSEYSFYAYPDYLSKNYESFLLKNVAKMLTEYNRIPEGNEIVVLLAQG